MALPQKQVYTSEDYWNLPDGQRAKLINGKLYAMAPPNRIHQELVSQFTKIIGQYIDTHDGSCKVYPAPFAVILTANDKVWVGTSMATIPTQIRIDEETRGGIPFDVKGIPKGIPLYSFGHFTGDSSIEPPILFYCLFSFIFLPQLPQ